jgi:hypothetical protein
MNLLFLVFRIDVGLPDEASGRRRALGAESVLLHLPGLRLTGWSGDATLGSTCSSL